MLEAPPPPRSPWQRLYGLGHRLRERFYDSRSRQLPRPTISIGNLHWGGTGKTPLVEAVAAHLRDGGRRVCILSRGYLSRGRGVRLVSDGEGPLLGPLVAGDEPVLLAGELPGVSVVVGPDRYRAGLAALERVSPPPEVFLLDDGFSHLKLARDLDLLVFPRRDPFGGGRLAPGGRLREPLASAGRADVALLTAAEPGEGAELAAALRPYGFTGPGFTSRTVPLPPLLSTGRRLAAGTPVVAVAGIARPQRFLAAARDFGLKIRHELLYGDHHAYPPRSLATIERAVQRAGAAAVVTTAKDYVKLFGRLDVQLARLAVRAEPEPAFWEWLNGELDGVGVGE